MNSLKDSTVEKYLGIVASSTPAVITQIPAEKQALLIKILSEYIQKNQLHIKINNIDSSDLNMHFQAIVENAKRVIGGRFREGMKLVFANDLYDNLLLSSIDQEGSFRELASKRLCKLKTTNKDGDLFDTSDEYFRAKYGCKRTIGNGKLRHLAIVTNVQYIKDCELHEVVNAKIAIDGNHDGNTPARTMITSSKTLDTYNNGTWRPIGNGDDYILRQGNTYFKELLKLKMEEK